jgi:hypothetical protein
MVATFSKWGISFQYPGNWSLSHEDDPSQARSISVQSPGSGFWMLQVYQGPVSAEELAAEALRTMRQEYDEIEVTHVHERIDRAEAVGYDMQFYFLDLIVTSRVRSFVVGDKTYVTMCQAEDREFEHIAPVFLAMTTSLMRTLCGAADTD